MRKRLLDFVLGTDGLPGWVCVGHPDPQAQLHVFLHTPSGSLDVTRTHVIVALKPLTVAVGIESSNLSAVTGDNPRFVIQEPDGSVLGQIKLQLSQSPPVHSAPFRLFRTLAGHNLCAPRLP